MQAGLLEFQLSAKLSPWEWGGWLLKSSIAYTTGLSDPTKRYSLYYSIHHTPLYTGYTAAYPMLVKSDQMCLSSSNL